MRAVWKNRTECEGWLSHSMQKKTGTYTCVLPARLNSNHNCELQQKTRPAAERPQLCPLLSLSRWKLNGWSRSCSTLASTHASLPRTIQRTHCNHLHGSEINAKPMHTVPGSVDDSWGLNCITLRWQWFTGVMHELAMVVSLTPTGFRLPRYIDFAWLV